MNFVGKKFGGQFVEKRIRHEFGVQDPYHNHVEYTDEDGKVHTEKRKREIPTGLSENDVKIIKKLRKRAYRLELAFSFLGCKVGWTSLIGFIPIVGTIWNLYLAYGTIKIAEKIDGGLNNWDRSRMTGNVGVDCGMGFVPFLGDICQAIYKCNTRNVIIVEDLVVKRANPGASPDTTPSHGSSLDGPGVAHTTTAKAI